MYTYAEFGFRLIIINWFSKIKIFFQIACYGAAKRILSKPKSMHHH